MQINDLNYHPFIFMNIKHWSLISFLLLLVVEIATSQQQMDLYHWPQRPSIATKLLKWRLLPLGTVLTTTGVPFFKECFSLASMSDRVNPATRWPWISRTTSPSASTSPVTENLKFNSIVEAINQNWKKADHSVTYSEVYYHQPYPNHWNSTKISCNGLLIALL